MLDGIPKLRLSSKEEPIAFLQAFVARGEPRVRPWPSRPEY